MDLAVAPGVSFCQCQGRFIFLDLNSERYFALNMETNQAFNELMVGNYPLSTEKAAALSELLQQGLLVAGANKSKLDGGVAPPAPTRSIMEAPGWAAPSDVIWVIMRLATAKYALRRKSLRRVIDQLRRRKSNCGLCDAPEDELIEIASAFRRSRLVATPLDQCLPRSLAAAHALLDRGYRSQFVIGVRLRPFAAHSWLQSGPILVNETVEQARNFTPILVV